MSRSKEDKNLSDKKWGLKQKKMKPYAKDSQAYFGKFEAEPQRHDMPDDLSSPTKHEKLITKNANRSIKKVQDKVVKKNY